MAIAAAVDERLVAEVWERQAFPAAALLTIGLRVVFRGVPSDAGGPDYQEVLLERWGRELIGGDVEFHVRSSDWYHHRHHRSQAYNRVLLHVVWESDGGATIRHDGQVVPQLELRSLPLTGMKEMSSPALIEHLCIPVYAALSETDLRAGIERAARVRFDERAERFALEAAIRSPEEALYVALLESLGYASNRQAFRDLAEVIPFAWLLAVPPELWTDVLLDAAGLGPPSSVPPPARLRPEVWRLSRLRPANHPVRRLEGLAILLQRLGRRPLETLLAALDTGASPASLRRLILVDGEDDALLGKGRADEIICSAILPFLAGITVFPGFSPGEWSVTKPVSHLPWQVFARYPSPPTNRWTRLMTQRLAQAGHQIAVHTAVEHQGLHHLYTCHCRPEKRAGCPLCANLLPN